MYKIAIIVIIATITITITITINQVTADAADGAVSDVVPLRRRH